MTQIVSCKYPQWPLNSAIADTDRHSLLNPVCATPKRLPQGQAFSFACGKAFEFEAYHSLGGDTVDDTMTVKTCLTPILTPTGEGDAK